MLLISRKQTERRARSADPVSCVGHRAQLTHPGFETNSMSSDSERAPTQTRVNLVLRKRGRALLLDLLQFEGCKASKAVS